MAHPRTIHHFGVAFRSFEAQYPAPGPGWPARAVIEQEWGWTERLGARSRALERVQADVSRRGVPVVQLSLDYTQPALFHYDLAKQLLPLRQKGVVLMLAAVTTNLGRVVLRGSSMSEFNQPFRLALGALRRRRC